LLIGSGTGTAAWGTPDGARVYNSANLTVSNLVVTALTFNSERYDNGGLHSTVTNTSRLTAQNAGKYLITAHLVWAANATGRRTTHLRLDGETYIATDVRPAIDGAVLAVSLATVYHLAASSYVEVAVYQNSGGDLDVIANLNDSPEFAMQWLGP